jgi:hypothetical protein
MWAAMALAIWANRKGGQVIENKQLREMAHFVPLMISMAYNRLAKPLVSLGERNPFAFAGFSASSRPKTQGSEINGGFGARAADVARVDDSEVAPPAPTVGRENPSGELRITRAEPARVVKPKRQDEG